MANAGNLISPRNFNPIIFNPYHYATKLKTLRLLSRFHSYNNNATVTASKRKDDLQSPLIGKNTSRAPRRLITISPGDGKYHGDWTCDYRVSLHDLELQDLIEDDNNSRKDAQVFINLSIQKSVEHGNASMLALVYRWMEESPHPSLENVAPVLLRIADSWVFVRLRKLSFGPLFLEFKIAWSRRYKDLMVESDSKAALALDTEWLRQAFHACFQLIDAKFNVWVLIARRDDRKIPLPDIGGDPNVIYVRPGYEVDLDSLVQDAIRLNSVVKDTCSELCEKSEGTIQYITGQGQASVDKRWSRLLELKKENL
ncbi:Large ribosomal RNA subunit accumulation protein YCED 2, chloroplastic [Glycine soja]